MSEVETVMKYTRPVFAAQGEALYEQDMGDLRRVAISGDFDKFADACPDTLSLAMRHDVFRRLSSSSGTHKEAQLPASDKKYESRNTQANFRLNESTGSVQYPKTCDTSQIFLDREKLPQINDPEDLIKDMQSKGIHVEHVTNKPSTLSPTQSEFREDKILSMVSDPECVDKPIIISRDLHVIDGHHRWLAAYNMNDRPIKCTMINLNAHQLLPMLAGKSYTHQASIHESISKLCEKYGVVDYALSLFEQGLCEGETHDLALREACERTKLDLGFMRKIVEALENQAEVNPQVNSSLDVEGNRAPAKKRKPNQEANSKSKAPHIEMPDDGTAEKKNVEEDALNTDSAGSQKTVLFHPTTYAR